MLNWSALGGGAIRPWGWDVKPPLEREFGSPLKLAALKLGANEDPGSKEEWDWEEYIFIHCLLVKQVKKHVVTSERRKWNKVFRVKYEI